MPADVQLGLFPDFVRKEDELALNFCHWCSCVLSDETGGLSEGQKFLLRKLDGILGEMSNGQSQDLWAEDALRNSPEWRRVRDVAAGALAAFGWEVEQPPSYRHEYVPGADT